MDLSKLLLDDTRYYRVMFESTADQDDYMGKFVIGQKTYYLGNKLGSGAYSNVYTCYEMDSGCIYAAKQYFQKDRPHEADVLKLVGQISHFGITRLIDAFEYEDHYYIIYELASGCSLESLLKMCKSKTDYVPIVPVELMKTLLRQLLVTCRFIHKLGVSHYDIKMDNIYILDHTRLMLLDFGQAYVCQDADYMETAKVLGNIAFMPPEVLLNTYIVGASFDDQNNIQISIQTQQQLYTYLRQMNPCPGPFVQDFYQKQVTLSRYHHIRTLFDPQRHTLESSNYQTHTKVWIAAIKRLYQFVPIGISQTPRAKNGVAAYTSLLGQHKSFVEQKFTASDAYPTYEDVQNIALQLMSPAVTRQNLHVFNKKLAIDSWSVGMIALILLIGEYPFRGIQQYEAVPAIYLLSEAIKHQLNSTLSNIVVGGDFTLYEYQTLRKQNVYYKIADGPLPTNIPTDLFLLIAGLLYPNPHGRLSVTECLGCPFIGAYQTYEEENDVPLDYVVVPSEQFEKVNESMSRIDRLRSSATIRTNETPFEEPPVLRETQEPIYMVEPSGEDSDDAY